MNHPSYLWKQNIGFIVILTIMLSSCLPFSKPLAKEFNGTMALPDWAYGQRQRLSPVLVMGEVMDVSCVETQCTLTMSVLEILRNQSQRYMESGDLISVDFVGNVPEEDQSPGATPPLMGSPVASVTIPTVGDHKFAWLRPNDKGENYYELMAGPYGFGPNLEGVE